MMLPLPRAQGPQSSLIQIVADDDRVLLESPQADWYRVLYALPWEEYRAYGAQYYDALYQFNVEQAKKRQERVAESRVQNNESREEARQRLLFERATLQDAQQGAVAILHPLLAVEPPPSRTEPATISPGVVPDRLGGKKPKCFFALLKSFIGTSLMGFAPEPENVHLLLCSNPSFMRVCGFAPKHADDRYCYEHVPSLRKLEQFDQIMNESGLWDRIKWREVRHNLEIGVIDKQTELVADTTHYHAYSDFETVTYEDEHGKEHKKSQSKPTKRCRCPEREHCEHPWELADAGAGTIVKSKNTMYWGHKASVIGYPRQGIPLDAAAVSDAATFDGKTLYPHVERLFHQLPEIRSAIQRILYDSACDDQALKEQLQGEFHIELKASFNPRRAHAVTTDLPRGIGRITPHGSAICWAGHEMDYQGIRYGSETFIYGPPKDAHGVAACLACAHKPTCCPHAQKGRTVSVGFDRLAHIDPQDPPMAKRFKAIMSSRPSVERMIKQLKCDRGDDRLTKRGNDSFQAYLDKTMIAFHILLRH
jgi:hypothetical protein